MHGLRAQWAAGKAITNMHHGSHKGLGSNLSKDRRLLKAAARFATLCVLAGVAGILLCGFVHPVRIDAATGINQEMSFEGKIVTSSGQNIPDGTYNMEFRIYTGCTNEPTGSTGCTPVWTEDYLNNNSQGVTFTSGTYQVNLGSICAFTTSTCENNSNTAVNWNSYPLYLSLQIGNTSNCSANNPGSSAFQADCGGDGVMNPFVLLTSTPYAMNANAVGGFTASQLGQLATNQTWTGTNTVQLNSSAAFAVQNTSGYNTMAADTSDGWLALGTSSHVNGAATFYNSSNANSVELLSGATTANGGSGYTITLPTGGASGTQCLESTSGSTTAATVLTFSACSGGGGGSGINDQTTTQSANFNVQAATSGSVAGVLEANASGSGDILDLQNGSGVNVTTFGSTGATLFKNSADSTTAFQVKDHSSDTVFNIDTTNQQITASQNSTSLNTPVVSLQQQGTGDATLGLQNSGGANSSFYISNDASTSNTFTINSYTAATGSSPTSFGSSAGTQTDSNGNLIQAGSFTAPVSGNLTSITVDFAAKNGADTFSVAVYADNGSNAPGTRLMSSTGTQAIVLPNGTSGHNLNTMNLSSPLSVTSGTTYWLAFNTDTSGDNFWFKGTGASSRCYYSNNGGAGITNGTWPTTAPTANQNNAGCAFNVTGTITAAGSLTDTNQNALFTLSQNGAAAFKNYNDSSAAFQIQNSSGTALFTADTSNLVITIAGTTSTFGSLTLTNVHFKSTQTTAPTQSNSGCGTSPTISVTAGSTDSAGKINVTTGTSPGGTCAVTVSFNKAYGAAPKSVILTGATSATSAKQWYTSATATSSFTASLPSPAASTAYTFYYWVIE